MTSDLLGISFRGGTESKRAFLIERENNCRGKFFPVWEMTRVGYGTASFGEYRVVRGLAILALES
jgi:hypothetical protein